MVQYNFASFVLSTQFVTDETAACKREEMISHSLFENMWSELAQREKCVDV